MKIKRLLTWIPVLGFYLSPNRYEDSYELRRLNYHFVWAIVLLAIIVSFVLTVTLIRMTHT